MNCRSHIVFTLVAAACCGSRAAAHALHAEARLKGDRVTVEAFYDDNSPAVNARITVADKQGSEIAAGRTDAGGAWWFPRPGPDKYEVTVDAGAGHRVRVSLTIPSEPALRAQSASRADDAEVIVTGGPTRAELTRFPWLRVGLGLGAIAALAAVLWLATRRTRSGLQRFKDE